VSGTTSIGRESRKHARGVLELPVLVSDPSSRVAGGIHFDAADISTGGAFLRTDLLLEVGELLMLEFRLPQDRGQDRGEDAHEDVHEDAHDGTNQGTHIRTAVRVTRVSRGRAKEVPGMGVEFIDLRAEDREAIEQRLRR
jgi:PilZ domain